MENQFRRPPPVLNGLFWIFVSHWVDIDVSDDDDGSDLISVVVFRSSD